MLHLYERFPESVKDDEWIGALGEQKHLVISGDSGRKTPRLPDLCRQHKQTHVLLSPTMHMKVNQFGKARAIIVLWPDLVKAYDSERGSRFQIQLVDKDYHSFRLVSKP
ncbi:MAG: hypothetical protein JW993_20250 [Sedimentisphaerales bacterium]|nr:hypothetical protein [Sedimentisphaerales bacterium]